MTTIRRLGSEDAAAFQALRLEGLARHPEAFAASYEAEVALAIERVQERLQRSAVFGGFQGESALRVVQGKGVAEV